MLVFSQDNPVVDGGERDEWDESVHTVRAVEVPDFRCPLTPEELFQLERDISVKDVYLDNLHVRFQEVKTIGVELFFSRGGGQAQKTIID